MLKRIPDSFTKIVVVRDYLKPVRDEAGILYMGIEQFLLDEDEPMEGHVAVFFLLEEIVRMGIQRGFEQFASDFHFGNHIFEFNAFEFCHVINIRCGLF